MALNQKLKTSGLFTYLISFSLLFVKQSLICLDGILTPHWEGYVIFHSFQQAILSWSGSLEGNFRLTGSPSRALNLALYIASGVSEIQEHRQLWCGRTGCGRSASKATETNLDCVFSKTSFYIAPWLWKADRLRPHFPAVSKSVISPDRSRTTCSDLSETCQMMWHSHWQQKNRAFVWVIKQTWVAPSGVSCHPSSSSLGGRQLSQEEKEEISRSIILDMIPQSMVSRDEAEDISQSIILDLIPRWGHQQDFLNVRINFVLKLLSML